MAWWDWEENAVDLSFQVGRWYPTAAFPANWSMLVMGGETGRNTSPQPKLDILLKPAGGSMVFDLTSLRSRTE